LEITTLPIELLTHFEVRTGFEPAMWPRKEDHTFSTYRA